MSEAPEPKSRPALTRTPAWRALVAHRRTWNDRHLRDLFAAEPRRFERFSLETCGLLADYSKNRITEDTMTLLLALARERGLPSRIAALLAGKRVNVTEKRAAWHTALRAGDAAPREVRRTLAAMRAFAQALRENRIHGATGEPVRDVVSIGIGGSALGPALAAAALAPDADHPRVHFIVAPGEPMARLLKTLQPATTLFIVQSKSFGTQETMLNAAAAQRWAAATLGESAGVHFAAVTANTTAAEQFGVAADRIFPMWDWVGGRYSLWSAVGLPAMIAMGPQAFDELLAGAAAMDAHFGSAAPEANLPLILALLDLWNINFFDAAAHAVMPYAAGLDLLPAWLQQLEMESLGKTVNLRGKPLRHDSGAVLWGGAGIEAQHACFQQLHQGTRAVPVDFIACCAPQSKSPWGTPSDDGTQAILLANCFAQSALLMRGVSAAETEQALLAGGASAREAARLAPHQALPGNRPSNTLLLQSLTPHSLGALLALYEHRTYALAALWDINAFDQYGVEHGKKLAGSLLPELTGQAPAAIHDASTNALIRHSRKHNRSTP